MTSNAYLRLVIAGFAILVLAAVVDPFAHGQGAGKAGTIPQGLFVLNNDQGPFPIPEEVWKNPLMDGASLRAGWGQIEPKEGQFNWFFDKDIARAKVSGKKVILRVYSGFKGKRMADWVYAAGAQRFDYTEGGEKMSMPIPWDKIFLQKWTAFIKAMGQRYDGDSTVVLVQMAGLCYTGGEMHLPKSPEDKANWARQGYSKDKLVSAWKTVIDAYATAFPTKLLCLNVSVPLQQDGVVEEVMAYGKQKLGKRFCVQHNALAGKTVETAFPHKWVTSMKGDVLVGFQQLCPATPSGKFNDEGKRYGGTLEQSLQIGQRAGMSYLEIYRPDMQNPEYRKTLEEYAKMMKGRTK